jgi:hypothetical protein
MAAHDRLGADIVQQTFGVNLQEQGRGFYVSLELLAIARGVRLHQPDNFLSPDVPVVAYERRSHDFARRIAVGFNFEENAEDTAQLSGALSGKTSLDTLNALLSSLLVEVPGRRKAAAWPAAHFHPFVGELIHYDAVVRRKRPSIERYTFRDGGGWAYHVLRSDPNRNRRARIGQALSVLVEDSGSALGRIAAALQTHDAARPSIFEDTSEAEIDTYDAQSPWPDTLRAGVANITERDSLPTARRIEGLMHWVPYCLARHQLHLARLSLGQPQELVLIDMTRDANPIRRRSQELLQRFRWDIAEALSATACKWRADATHAGDVARAERLSKYVHANANFTKSPRAFFSESLAAVGALNATSGRRHFTLKIPMLETMVAALLQPGEEEEFHRFCRRLFEQLRVVVDDRTARGEGLTRSIDGGVFRVNSEAFRSRLSAAGLLTHYSDATSIVHGEPK